MVVRGTPEQQMLAVADAQRGRVAGSQLAAVGMTPAMVKTHLRKGMLRPDHRGVFVVGHNAPVAFGDEAAALLAFGRDAGLTHASAVWVWGFTRERPQEVHVTLIAGRYGRSRPGIRLHRSRTLTPGDLTFKYGLPVARPARALLEYADIAEPRQLELAVDEALTLRAVSRTKLREELARSGAGRAGAAVLADLIEAGRPSSITRSEGEERLRNLILSAGIPPPQMQSELRGFEADCYWPEARYVAEFDGFDFHRTRTAWRRDRIKDRVYARDGIRLDRFTWEDVTSGALATAAHISYQVAVRTLRFAAGPG
jgi:hypothetical protein